MNNILGGGGSINTGLFIFHRDLRIRDNIGLIQASSQCKKLYTCFIFTPEQISKTNNYRSINSIQFMIESLDELSKDIRRCGGELVVLYGKQHQVLNELIDILKIDAVFFNRDYSPYAIQRDTITDTICKKKGIECIQTLDYYLYEPGTVKNKQGGYYKKFTPFYEEVVSTDIIPVSSTKETTLHLSSTSLFHKSSYITTLQKIQQRFIPQTNPEISVNGGRINGVKKLNSALQSQSQYDKARDYLHVNTSMLSAYIKFGCISIREVYHVFTHKYGKKCGFIRELIWREFFAHVLFAFPEVLEGGYHTERDKWKTNQRWLTAWKRGETGFPIVDACMHQLNETGYMHNRGRMIVANFLVKTLGLDWREGELYFAQKLTDYDPASNNGNWQSISGTGVDMRPFFRDMNPWIQSTKFDHDAIYIKKWLPELESVVPTDLHKWYEKHNDPKYKDINYNKPIVDYTIQKKKVLDWYQK